MELYEKLSSKLGRAVPVLQAARMGGVERVGLRGRHDVTGSE